MRKKLLIILIGIIYLFKINNVNAIIQPTDTFYINDYANILNEETEQYILNNSVVLEKATTAQVVVITVPNLEGKNIEEYATEVFREFGIGTKEKNNGLLLLLALEERQFRVEVGYGLEEVLPDGLTGRYQDTYIIPHLKEDNWDEGIKNGYTAFVQTLCEYYGVDTLTLEEIDLSTTSSHRTSLSEEDIEKATIPATLGFVFGIITYLLLNNKNKTKKQTTALVINIVVLLLETYLLSIGSVIIHVITEALTIFFIYLSSTASKYTGGYYSTRSGRSSFGSFRSGGFRGGGGRSGGGGSSRRF